jgi:hypothetical protein
LLIGDAPLIAVDPREWPFPGLAALVETEPETAKRVVVFRMSCSPTILE